MIDTDMNTLFPNHEFKVNDEVIVIKPFTFGQLPKVLKLSSSFYGAVQPIFEQNEDMVSAVSQVIAIGGDDLIELLGMSINKPREWFDSIQSDIGIQLLAEFLEVNLSFFAQRILPQLEGAIQKVQKISTQLPLRT